MAKLHFLKSVTDTINNSFILESNQELLVLDGGFATEAPYMYEYLKKLGGHVTGWFLTHVHNDHVSCLHGILSSYPDIKVDKIYYNFPSDEFIIHHAPMQDSLPSEEILRRFREDASERCVELVTVQKNDVYTFDGGNVTVRVLRVPDESIVANAINNSSVVYRFEADNKSILFLGDLGIEGGDQLLNTTDPHLLKSDYLQMSHHGQGGVSKEFYARINPTYCFWPTPSWLWDNLGPGGYDTGKFKTLITRAWISEMQCVKKHYLMTDATHVIDLINN
jgi:beta-lactamase superfamily II metal-dependent hydrolase